MSTLFVVMVPEGSYQCEVEEEDIPKGYYEAVAHRGNSGKMRWKNPIAQLLPIETKVYPWDNTAQGIFTIGDIIKEIKEQEIN